MSLRMLASVTRTSRLLLLVAFMVCLALQSSTG